MNNRTVHYNDFNINIIQNVDNVTITCLDKIMHKAYQYIFTNEYVREMVKINNLDNFYNIINGSFDNNTFTVMNIQDNVIIPIIYNDGLVFNFELRLPLTEQTELTADSLYIKQLEDEIEELKQSVHVNIGSCSFKINTGIFGVSSDSLKDVTVSYIVPMYIDLIIIKSTSNKNIIMPNEGNAYNIDCAIYNDKTLTVTLLSGNNSKQCKLNSYFLSLKPKKITFEGIPLDTIDYSCFPKER
jgi:hypothetical protein